eukprot:3409799-Prymnesium_polylepis.1
MVYCTHNPNPNPNPNPNSGWSTVCCDDSTPMAVARDALLSPMSGVRTPLRQTAAASRSTSPPRATPPTAPSSPSNAPTRRPSGT